MDAVVAALLQLYAVPPDAVRMEFVLLQIASAAGEMPAVGFTFTVTPREAVPVQPLLSVIVTE